MAFLVSFFHLSNSFQVNSEIGPLQLSLMKMCQDVGKFLLLFGLVFLSFSMAVRKVYSQFEQIVDLYPANTKKVRAAHEFSRWVVLLRLSIKLHSVDMLLKHYLPGLTNAQRRFQRLSGSCSLVKVCRSSRLEIVTIFHHWSSSGKVTGRTCRWSARESSFPTSLFQFPGWIFA